MSVARRAATWSIRQADRLTKWLASSKGVMFSMAMIMVGLTLVTALDSALDDLPFKRLLLLLSSIAAVVGLWVVFYGRQPYTVGWVGMTFALCCAVRAVAWLSTWSWTGFFAWQPGILLGFVVFQRRAWPEQGGGHDPTST